MKAGDLFQILRVAPPDKWIRFYDDAHREILDFFKCITDGVITYSLRYGMVRIEDVISIVPYGVEQDCVELISEGNQYAVLELYDLRYVGYDEDEEEYEKSEKDAMWNRDRMSFYKNKMTKDDEEYILYGFEGNICIWQKLKGSTHHETRVFYANPGRELTARTTGELRIKINEYLNGGSA